MYNKEKMIQGIELFLEGLGQDLDDQHLRNTPKRVTKAWINTFGSGYSQKIEDILNVEFTETYDEMVVIKDIPFISFCAHHVIPFTGVAKIGYIPNGKVTGLSKLARLLDMYAHRLQIQERLTDQIAKAINEQLQPKGIGVVLQAEHMCMTRRGVQKPGSITITSTLIGAMKNNDETRQEFLSF